MDQDLISTVGREVARLAAELGVADAAGQDGYEAFARAGLVEALTPAGIGGLDGRARERLRRALSDVLEVAVSDEQVAEVLARIGAHRPG